MIHFILTFLAVFLTVNLVGVGYAGWVAVLLLTVVIGLVNLLIKPILKFITIPINILTLGIFHLIVNVLMIMLATNLTPGISPLSFWKAALFGIVLSLIEAFLFRFIDKEK